MQPHARVILIPALINFQRALLIQPGNAYAAAAADNMAFYIQYGRVSTRQRAITQLQSTLTSAITQKDWVCAATTIDQLTTYTEPGSLNRERLIGQRGEIKRSARCSLRPRSMVYRVLGPAACLLTHYVASSVTFCYIDRC